MTGTCSYSAAKVAAKSYVLTSTGVKIPLAAGDVTPAPSGKKVSFDLGNAPSSLPAGSYTLVIEAGAIVDDALNGGNKNNEIRESVVVATDGLATKPKITTPIDATSTAGEIVVTFDEQVSYASVADSSNYVIDGSAIPAASDFVLDNTGKVLTITLPEATYTETASKVIKINGVRNLSGILMEEHEEVLTVNENEKINLQSAKIVNGEIILTFNEDVTSTEITTTFATGDILVKVNGINVTGSLVVDRVADTAATKVEKNQLRVSAPANVSFQTGTVTVDIDPATTVVDAVGNGVKLPTAPIVATR